MPKKLQLSDVIERLPKFVRIVPETYRGARYEAEFIDLEYNEKFKAIVGSVIKLQHGCSTRSNELRSKTNLKIKFCGQGNMYPIELVKNELPNYLEIDEKSYTGKRNKARFFDKDFKVWFEAWVCNVLRDGKGYCEQRRLEEFKKQIKIPLAEIEQRIFELYGDTLKLIPETYTDTNNQAKFYQNGKIKSLNVQNVLLDKIENETVRKRNEWKKEVFQRDNFTCQVCNSTHKPRPHHLNSWNKYPEQRFDLENGICLCESHHKEFHSKFGNGDNTRGQFLKWLESKAEANKALIERLSKAKSPDVTPGLNESEKLSSQ